MRILLAFAVPAIVVTSLMHAGVAPALPPPAALKLSPAERARLATAHPGHPRRAARASLHPR